MIDRPNCAQRKVEVHVSVLIHVSSTTSVSVVYSVCRPCRICQCVWVLSVCVLLPLSIRQGWALLLKGGHSGPPIQSGALGRSNVLSALMRSRCPFSWDTGRERGGGRMWGWSTLKQTSLAHRVRLCFVSCSPQGGCCWCTCSFVLFDRFIFPI